MKRKPNAYTPETDRQKTNTRVKIDRGQTIDPSRSGDFKTNDNQLTIDKASNNPGIPTTKKKGTQN